jgi:hypothetical protein
MYTYPVAVHVRDPISFPVPVHVCVHFYIHICVQINDHMHVDDETKNDISATDVKRIQTFKEPAGVQLN